MTQTSKPWDGTTVGDPGPYSSDVWTSMWQVMFTRDDSDGIIDDYLNELVVAGVSGGVTVASGGALVDGTFYENDSQETVVIDTPVTDPRIDRIVLRKDWGTQIIRIALLDGTENPAPTAPALTQTAGGIWEIPLAQIEITIAGAITVTDERQFPIGRIFPTAGMTHIETITSSGSLTQFDFQDIPDLYKHLKIEAQLRLETLGANLNNGFVGLRINGDSGANYNFQSIRGFNAASSAIAASTTGALLQAITSNAGAGFVSQGNILIPNYQSTIYKNIFGSSMGIPSSTVADFNTFEVGTIWLNTSIIERLTLTVLAGADVGQPFTSGSTVSLYGIS